MGPALLVRVTRAKTLPLVLAPVCVGAALAFDIGRDQGRAFSWAHFVVALAGAAALHLAANVVNDVFDTVSSADKMARMDRSGIATSSGVIDDGTASARQLLTLAFLLYATAFACGVALAVSADDVASIWWIGAAGAALGLFYSGPPVRYGYIGRGLGEIGIAVAYGLLPVLGGFVVQAGTIRPDARWAGLVPGLLTAVAISHHNLLHHRADKAVRKMTPAVVLGPEGALIATALVLTVAYAALAIQVAIGLFPAWALAGLLPAIPVAAAWARAFKDPLPQASLNLLGASLGASVLCSIAIALALVAG